MTYRVTLTNPEGLRLTIHVGNDTHEQPYDRAEREVNADPQHARFGHWTAIFTERAS